MYCKRFKAVLATENIITSSSGNRERLMSRARCKQWSCEACSITNRKIWRKRVFHHLDNVTEYEQWSFFTLTPSRLCLQDDMNAGERDETSLKNIRSGLTKFMERLRRKFGKHEYVRVFERFKKGGYHVHFLYSHQWDDIEYRVEKDGTKTPYSAWIKRNANECGMGYITHAANLESTMQSAMYITKYMTKGENKLDHGLRRIQASRGFTSEKQLPSETSIDAKWSLHHAIVGKDIEDAIERGYEWVDINIGKVVTSDNVEDMIGYPFNQPD